MQINKDTVVPDERETQKTRQSNSELEMSPVTYEVSQKSEERPCCYPEKIYRGSGNRTIDCWEQLACHYCPDKRRTLDMHSV